MNAVTLATELTQSEAPELPSPQSMEWDEALEVYRNGQAIEQAGWFVMGYAASCVDSTYGTASLEEFAGEVDIPYSTIKDQRRVYKRLMSLNKDDQSSLLGSVKSGVLSYTNLLLANPLQDDEEYVEVLEQAQDEGWSKRTLAEEVATRRGLKPAYTREQPDQQLQQGQLVNTELVPGQHPVREEYPQLSYQHIGYASTEQLDTMQANLQEMTQEEREEVLQNIEKRVPGALARLAGMPYYGEDAGDTPSVIYSPCPHCKGTGRVKRQDYEEIGGLV